MLKVTLINVVLTALAVWTHYECLRYMGDRLEHLTQRRRIHLLLAVFGALAAHVVEIVLYGLGFYLVLADGSLGEIAGAEGSLRDCVYFSISNFTSLGMGDLQPIGPVRFIAGFETLTGLVLITWTASFLFLEMQKIWARGNEG